MIIKTKSSVKKRFTIKGTQITGYRPGKRHLLVNKKNKYTNSQKNKLFLFKTDSDNISKLFF